MYIVNGICHAGELVPGIKVKEAIDSASTEEEKKAIALSYENWKWNFSKIRRMRFAWDEISEIQAKFKDSND